MSKKVRMSSSFMLSSDEASASMRSSSIELSSDEVKESMISTFNQSSEEIIECCDPCTIGEGIEKEALFYCQECKEFLCGDCREFHRKVSITRNHQVSRIDESKTRSHRRDKVDELSKHFCNVTVSGATGKTQPDQTKRSVKHLGKATLTNKFNASLNNDKKTCDLRGIILVDNLVYVADNGNGNIKLFYNCKTGKFLAKYSEADVWDLTAIGKNRIALTSLKNYFTIIERTKNKLNFVKSIDTSIPTWGIDFYNSLIYVSCCYTDSKTQKSQIKVYTSDGEPKQTIEPIGGLKRVLKTPCYISISQRTDTIYVSDFHSGVLAVSFDGKLQFVKQVFNMKNSAQGIAIDDQGKVYVCGLSTHNIMAISDDGCFVSEVLNKECENAQALAIVGQHMYVCCRNSNIVNVFTLS